MCRRLRHKHRDIAADAGKLWQRLQRFGRVSPRQQSVEVQLRQQHGVAQIVLPCQQRRELAQLAECQFSAQLNLPRFEEHWGTFDASVPGHATQAKLLQEFLQQPFQVVEVNFSATVVSTPERRQTMARHGDREETLLLHRTFHLLPASSRGRRSGRALEHTPDFEQRNVNGFVMEIVPQRTEQSGNQARP